MKTAVNTIFAILLILIASCNLGKQNDNIRMEDEIINLSIGIIQDSLNKNVVNHYDTIRLVKKLLKNDYIDFVFVKDLNLFTQNDFQHMISQDSIDTEYDFSRVNNRKLKYIGEDFIAQSSTQNLHKSCYSISKPLFSIDSTKALVNINYHCYDCGHGFIVIFQKHNGKWIINKILKTWLN